MKHKTEEFLLIALAIIIFIAISIVIKPSTTGFAIYEFSITPNEDIITEGGIQLKQHSYTVNWTTEEISHYTLIFAEENGNDRLNKLIAIDKNLVEIEKNNLLKIKFNNNLQDLDILNFYIKGNEENIINICDFELCNETYATISYPGQNGNYQITLSLQNQVDGITIDPITRKAKIDYINASHTEIIHHSDTTYYYNSAEIETEIIQPESLLKWDLFTVDYTLNNQTINFYYTPNEDYIEFTPPYNFSEINSSNLKFKLALLSDNSSTPIIHNLSISYIIEPCIENWECSGWSSCIEDSQSRNCADLNVCGTEENKPAEIQECVAESDEESSSNSGEYSATRFKSSSPAPVENAKTETTEQTVTQQIELPKVSGEVIEETEVIEEDIPIKLYGNIFLFSLLTLVGYAYYHKGIKNKLKIEIIN